MRYLGAVVLLSSGITIWQIGWILLAAYQSRRFWRKLNWASRRRILTWHVMAAACGINGLLAIFTIATGSEEPMRWIVRFILPLMCLLFATVPCSSPRIRTSRRWRVLRTGGLVIMAVVSILSANRL